MNVHGKLYAVADCTEGSLQPIDEYNHMGAFANGYVMVGALEGSQGKKETSTSISRP